METQRVEEPSLVPRGSFVEWLKDRGAELWSVLHFGSVGNEEFRDEFIDVLTVNRRRFASILQSKGAKLGSDQVTRLFLKEWLKRQSRRRLHVDKEDLDWDLKILLCAPYCLGWSLDSLAEYLDLSNGAVRFRAFQALKRHARLEGSQLRHLNRDCVRHDLFFIDLSLGLKWADPAAVTDPKSLLEHRRECERCKRISDDLTRSIQAVRQTRLHQMPADLLESFDGEGRMSSSRIVSPSWFSKWPWPLKAPARAIFALALLAAVLSIPFIGDTGPRLREWANRIANRADKPAVQVSETHPAPVAQVAQNESIEPVEIPSPPLEKQKAPAPKPAAPKPVAPVVVAEKLAIEPVEMQSPPMVRQPKPIKKPEPQIVAKAEPPAPVEPAKSESPAPQVAKSKTKVPVVIENAPKADTAAGASAVVAMPTAESEGDVDATGQVNEEEGEQTRVFYRWGAFSSDLDQDSTRLMEILNRYGAVKSGELELGASYRGGRYFHFSLPKDKYSELLRDVQALHLADFTNSRAVSERLTPSSERRVVFLVRPR